jgi:hypothetical protein
MSKVLIVLGAAVLLGGCITLGGPPPPTRSDAEICREIANSRAKTENVYDPKTETDYVSCMSSRGHQP